VAPWGALEAAIEPHYPTIGPHGGRRPFALVPQFVNDESGATAIEYGLIAALLGVGIIAGAQSACCRSVPLSIPSTDDDDRLNGVMRPGCTSPVRKSLRA
jgi:hypothetical protein